jgi:hypothetical protein
MWASWTSLPALGRFLMVTRWASRAFWNFGFLKKEIRLAVSVILDSQKSPVAVMTSFFEAFHLLAVVAPVLAFDEGGIVAEPFATLPGEAATWFGKWPVVALRGRVGLDIWLLPSEKLPGQPLEADAVAQEVVELAKVPVLVAVELPNVLVLDVDEPKSVPALDPRLAAEVSNFSSQISISTGTKPSVMGRSPSSGTKPSGSMYV